MARLNPPQKLLAARWGISRCTAWRMQRAGVDLTDAHQVARHALRKRQTPPRMLLAIARELSEKQPWIP